MDTVAVGDLTIGDGHPPRIMGVLNVSEESPYDPSVYDDPETAANYVEESLIAEGADIIDVGLESANKRFETLSATEELDRLDIAVETIELVDSSVVFSIETRYATVADAALSRGFDMINDICGFADPDMADVARDHDAAVVKMASPPDIDRPGAVDEVDWKRERSPEWASDASYVDKIYAALERGGFTDKTIVDPAFGGWSSDKTLADDHETFHRLREFRALGRPMLVSINRKNFLKTIADRETAEALPVSLGATAMAVERGAHIVRTHDVAETRDAALVGHEFTPDLVTTDHLQELAVTETRELRRHVERVENGESDELPTPGVGVSIADLERSERDRLVAAVSGTSVTMFGSDPYVLTGPADGFESIASALDGTNPTLDSVANALRRVVFNEKTYTGWE